MGFKEDRVMYNTQTQARIAQMFYEEDFQKKLRDVYPEDDKNSAFFREKIERAFRNISNREYLRLLLSPVLQDLKKKGNNANQFRELLLEALKL